MEKKKSADITSKKTNGKGLLKKAEKLQKENVQQSRETKVKIKKSLLTNIFVRLITTVLLLIVLFFGIKHSVKKINVVTMDGKTALVDKQLSYCQELVTLKLRYSDIVTIKKSSGFAKSYSIVKFTGILRCGISDITDVFYDISSDGKTIKLKIPPAEILGNDILSQEVFDEKQSIFVPITTQEVFNEIEEARKNYQEDAVAEGLLNEAYSYCERIIKQMMMACGFENIIIQ